MKVIQAGYTIINKEMIAGGGAIRTLDGYTINNKPMIDGGGILRTLESIGRTCYKSESKITNESAPEYIKMLMARGHEAMLEHYSVSVRIICDRGVSHELVRHRIASFAQESTRYCNYGDGKFGKEITVIEPLFFKGVENKDKMGAWLCACSMAEIYYIMLLDAGANPEEARSVLPNSLKTEIIVTMNLRSWRHFFKLRAAGVTGKPHPQMLEITVPMLAEFKKLIPVIFDDIEVKNR